LGTGVSLLAEQPAEDFIVKIQNCNSITDAQITLRRSALNIKYGANGVGKSTIARSLMLGSGDDGALDELIPFKHRDGSSTISPSVDGAESIKSVLVFDDDYVSQFVFQRDEVLKDSFEIFINTPEYKAGNEQIEALFEALKDTFNNQEAFDDALVGFTDLHGAFAVTKTGAISKASRGFKAIGTGLGGKLKNIPEPLQGYTEFLHSHDPASWITWQSKGKAFLELSENCPFCSVSDVNKETAQNVSKEYESAAVKNLSALRDVIDRLGTYFEDSHREQLEEITTSIEELTPEQIEFIKGLRGQIETFLGKLTALRALSFRTLRDETNVDAVLRDLKIELSLLRALNSEETAAVVELINSKLDEVSTRVNEVRARIGKQKSQVAKLIKENQDEINQFLRSAGYRYTVRIEPDANSYRMIVEHEDAAGHLESASTHLSYGEKNAFALVLFMHHVRQQRPDLVVLDDPVSSFDKTKKFAILHQLFHGKNSIRDFTTLFLTHDIEPAIDIVLNPTSNQFIMSKPLVHFLRSQAGQVTEKPIEKEHISTFSQVCEDNIASAADEVIRCIYLRRLYEVHGERGDEYDILSSLLHLRDVPDTKNEEGERTPLEPERVTAAMNRIRKHIPDLDYGSLVSELRDPIKLKAKFDATDVGYEKVQIFRILSTLDGAETPGDSAFKKFVNESYHIENEYVMQLNPRDFDTVPEHVIKACHDLFNQAANTSDVEKTSGQ
jgi:energy-coupling factor transporter ATP-binding protein EcfA2